MNKHQYAKLENKLGIKYCPICGRQAIYCAYNKVNIFCKNGESFPFEDVDIPQDKYIELECKNCGFIMRFNIEKLLL